MEQHYQTGPKYFYDKILYKCQCPIYTHLMYKIISYKSDLLKVELGRYNSIAEFQQR